jgi:site-specific recombinase XerD
VTTGHAQLRLVGDPAAGAPEPSLVEWRLARITSLLDPRWRPREWDPAAQTITYDPDDPLVFGDWCRVAGCDVTTASRSRLCLGCSVRWRNAGEPGIDAWARGERPSPPRQQRHGRLCRVAGGGDRCPRPACNRRDLCLAHEAQRHRMEMAGAGFEDFLACAVPMASLGICAAVVCDEPVHLKALCTRHFHHWQAAGEPAGDELADWARRAAPNSHGRVVCLRGLHPLAAAEVLYGLQARDREQSKTNPATVTGYVNLLRDRQVFSVLDLDVETTAEAWRQRRTASVIRDRVQLAYAEPETERLADVWDARVFGHQRATVWDFSAISQDWLREVTKSWAFVAQTRLAPTTLQSRVRSMAQLSRHLSRRAGGGCDATRVARAELESFAVALNRDVARGKTTNETRRSTLKDVRCVLDEARAAGLLEAVADTFSLTKDLIPAYVSAEEEPGQALPDCVVAQLSGPAAAAELRKVGLRLPGVMGERSGDQWVLLFETLRDTGRRPAEVTSLGVDAVARDHDGGAVLVYDNRKSRRHGRRLPIGEELHAKLLSWQQVVLARFPATPRDQLALFPRPTRNRDGTHALRADQFGHKFADWVSALDRIDGPDRGPDGQPLPFPRDSIYPYAFRHTYAQRHADAGTPVEVLQALMDHTDLKTTQGYYRITSKRKREATERLAQMRRGVTGEARPLAGVSDAGHLRDGVAQIAVPFGLCAEPSNVRAGGQQCPIRYRCMGCAYFASDPSFLPELKAHLDELVRAREHGQAIGADDWALVPTEEVARLRTLIRALETDLAQLPDDERRLVEQTCADLRTARRSVPVSIGRRTP